MRMAVEEHGSGRQFVRLRTWPRYSRIGLALIVSFAALSASAALAEAWIASVILGLIAVLVTVSAVRDCATATGVLARVLDGKSEDSDIEVRVAPKGPLHTTPTLAGVTPAASGHQSENGKGHEAPPSAPLGDRAPAPQVIPFSSKHD